MNSRNQRGEDLLAALTDLEEAWDSRMPGMSGWAAPGLAAGDVRRALASADLGAPECLLAWFAWHDGTMPDQYLPMTPIWTLSSLSTSLDITRMMREVAVQVPEVDLWGPELFSLVHQDGEHLVVDTSEDWGPVWYAPRDGAWEARRRQATDLVDLVRGWVVDFEKRDHLWDGGWLPRWE